jgi:hypothetical protein
VLSVGTSKAMKISETNSFLSMMIAPLPQPEKERGSVAAEPQFLRERQPREGLENESA